jgi:hypothetical protein
MRTLREALEGEELPNLVEAKRVLARVVRWYNEERLHSALGYLPPATYYRGDPAARYAERRKKLVEARHRRREGTSAWNKERYRSRRYRRSRHP